MLYITFSSPPFHAIAYVEIVKNKSDKVIWEHSFVESDTVGQLPIIRWMGEHLSVEYPDPLVTPRLGLITARAKIYSNLDVLLSTSNDITLAIVAGGGGS